MTRLQADALLLITALIWGTAFVAQKTGLDSVGPYTFVAARFALSFVAVVPFALRERAAFATLPRAGKYWLAAVTCAFVAGVVLQQIGLITTSVTNAGFLTGLYVVMVPFVSWAILGRRPSGLVIPAALMSITGVYLLGGGGLDALTIGDWLVIGSAVGFALHVTILARLFQDARCPLIYSAICYGAAALAGTVVALLSETITLNGLWEAAPEIAYAGIMSGAIAYTLQAIAQQYTPPADAAVILSGEALFAALAGAVLLSEYLTPIGWTGCALILAAMLLVELGPMLGRARRRRRA